MGLERAECGWAGAKRFAPRVNLGMCVRACVCVCMVKGMIVCVCVGGGAI